MAIIDGAAGCFIFNQISLKMLSRFQFDKLLAFPTVSLLGTGTTTIDVRRDRTQLQLKLN